MGVPSYSLFCCYCLLLFLCRYCVDVIHCVLPLDVKAVDVSDASWSLYKLLYNKTYHSPAQERLARASWRENHHHIHSHNLAGHSYSLKENHLMDLTMKQYLRRIVKLVGGGRQHHEPHERHTLTRERLYSMDVPDYVDWTALGYQPQFPSQRHCGACYAFTVSHALQAQLFKEQGFDEALSEQQLIDCSTSYGNYGCNGGSLRNAMQYLHDKGAMRYADYPYLGKSSKCRWNRRYVVANITSWGPLPRGDEDALQRAVGHIGPIPVSLNAAPRSFKLYHQGVYDDPQCSSATVNHAMLVVGYTPSYWILINWWGPYWGDGGYMKLRRGVNRCGIANFASYLTIT